MPTPVQLIVFEKDLAKNIFPDNSYIRRSRNDDSMVNAGSVVLPQSGTVPNVQLNRVGQSSLTERIDSVLTYNINEFTSDATLIRDFDALTVNYAKREDVLRDHREQLYKTVCNYTNYQWMLGSAMMRTTGGNRTIGIAPGATGTRKLITLADIKNAKARLDKQDIPSDGRCLLLDSDMLNDLLDDPKLTSRDYADSPNLVTGSIGRILGLDIYTRSSVLAFDSAGTAKSPFAAAAATDNASALLWHPDFVRFAYSGVKVYMQLDVPVAYGSQFSAMAMTGASKVYANGRGMVNIVEQP